MSCSPTVAPATDGVVFAASPSPVSLDGPSAAEGVSSVSSSTGTSTSHGWREQLDDFDREMRSLEEHLSRDYFIARQHVPDIVAIESDPTKFLATSNGHIREAATRTAKYWELRRQYFGEERWMRPMTQTEGSGALSLSDIQVLRSGYIVVATFPSGQQMALIDPSRLNGRDPGQARERCLFYLATNEMKNHSARYGLEMIYLLTRFGYASERHTELIEVLYGALPAKFRHLTILQSIQEDGRQELLDFLSFRLEKTFALLTPTKVSVVRVVDRDVVVEAFQRRGIHQRYLPQQLGGEYDYYSKMPEWVESRVAVETAMAAALPHRNMVPSCFRRARSVSTSSLRTESRALPNKSSSPSSYASSSSIISIVSLVRDTCDQRKRHHSAFTKRRKKKASGRYKHIRSASSVDLRRSVGHSKALMECDADLKDILSRILDDYPSTMSL